jgi:hypothetical protein
VGSMGAGQPCSCARMSCHVTAAVSKASSRSIASVCQIYLWRTRTV